MGPLRVTAYPNLLRGGNTYNIDTGKILKQHEKNSLKIKGLAQQWSSFRFWKERTCHLSSLGRRRQKILNTMENKLAVELFQLLKRADLSSLGLLIQAIQQNASLETVKQVLELDPGGLERWGDLDDCEYPIFHAIKASREDIVRYFIELYLERNLRFKLRRILLREGSPARDDKLSPGRTFPVAGCLVQTFGVDVVRYLFDKGVLSAEDVVEHGLLHIAVQAKQVDTANFVVALCPYVAQVKDNAGVLPFIHAASLNLGMDSIFDLCVLSVDAWMPFFESLTIDSVGLPIKAAKRRRLDYDYEQIGLSTVAAGGLLLELCAQLEPNMEAIRELVNRYPKAVLYVADDGLSPLRSALLVYRKNVDPDSDLVTLLIEEGVKQTGVRNYGGGLLVVKDENFENTYAENLSLLIASGCVGIAERLAKLRPPMFHANDIEQYNLVHFAFRINANPDMIRLLLEMNPLPLTRTKFEWRRVCAGIDILGDCLDNYRLSISSWQQSEIAMKRFRVLVDTLVKLKIDFTDMFESKLFTSNFATYGSDMAEYLINAGFVTAARAKEFRLLHNAVDRNEVDVARLLINLSPALLSWGSEDECGRLPIAMINFDDREKSLEMLRLLLEEGCKYNVGGKFGIGGLYDQGCLDRRLVAFVDKLVLDFNAHTMTGQEILDGDLDLWFDYAEGLDIVQVKAVIDSILIPRKVPILTAAFLASEDEDEEEYEVELVMVSNMFPWSVNIKDSSNRLPIHVLIVRGMPWHSDDGGHKCVTEVLEDCWQAQAAVKDGVTGLLPFALAASHDDPDLDAVYDLFRATVDLVSAALSLTKNDS